MKPAAIRWGWSVVKALAWTALTLFLLCIWYAVAANYDYGALAGTYYWHAGAVSCTLHLKADATFKEDLTESGTRRHASGTWQRSGEGFVAFSPEFLRLPGHRSFADSPDSDASQHPEIPPEFWGHFEKIWTVYPKLSLDGGSNEVVLHRKLFR